MKLHNVMLKIYTIVPMLDYMPRKSILTVRADYWQARMTIDYRLILLASYVHPIDCKGGRLTWKIF